MRLRKTPLESHLTDNDWHAEDKDREPTLEEIAATVNDVNVILAEGYKRTGKLKVEMVRAARSTEPICTPDELLALVTDVAVPYGVPQFGLDDVVGLADLIETLM